MKCFKNVCVPAKTFKVPWFSAVEVFKFPWTSVLLGETSPLSFPPLNGSAATGKSWVNTTVLYTSLSCPVWQAISSGRLASLLTPGQSPGVNKGERIGEKAKTLWGTFALKSKKKGSLPDKWHQSGGSKETWQRQDPWVLEITVLKRQKPETKVPLGHTEFPNLF